MKRTTLYSSEADINVESNPYSYKLAPGYQVEVMFPMMLEQLRLLRKVAADKLTPTETDCLDELEKKTETLLAGGYVGNPKRRLKGF
jgi:hypothetical protein